VALILPGFSRSRTLWPRQAEEPPQQVVLPPGVDRD
jgi:hypothetical protein